MGSSLYYYFTPYQDDIGAALHALRQQEFRAGRYDPVISMLGFKFPPDANSPAPGPEHATIKQAMLNEDDPGAGTRSILDLCTIASQPDLCAACPFSDEELDAMWGSAKPSRQQVEPALSTWQNWTPAMKRILASVKRGQGRYIILYADGAPAEILFMGYSFD